MRLRLYFYEYKQDAILAGIAVVACLLGTVVVGVMYLVDMTPEPVIQSQVIHAKPTLKPLPGPKSIFVDVSGAVVHSGTYELSEETRLGEALEQAGGMNRDAAQDYVNRNYNFARIVADQEKIYIPSKEEIDEGTFVEATFYIENQMVMPTLVQKSSSSQLAVPINSASKEELDTLPGVGPATAEKIIQNRPYVSADELVGKAGLSESTVDKFSDDIRYD